jgi:hypothetical protein
VASKQTTTIINLLLHNTALRNKKTTIMDQVKRVDMRRHHLKLQSQRTMQVDSRVDMICLNTITPVAIAHTTIHQQGHLQASTSSLKTASRFLGGRVRMIFNV